MDKKDVMLIQSFIAQAYCLWHGYMIAFIGISIINGFIIWKYNL